MRRAIWRGYALVRDGEARFVGIRLGLHPFLYATPLAAGRDAGPKQRVVAVEVREVVGRRKPDA